MSKSVARLSSATRVLRRARSSAEVRFFINKLIPPKKRAFIWLMSGENRVGSEKRDKQRRSLSWSYWRAPISALLFTQTLLNTALSKKHVKLCFKKNRRHPGILVTSGNTANRLNSSCPQQTRATKQEASPLTPPHPNVPPAHQNQQRHNGHHEPPSAFTSTPRPNQRTTTPTLEAAPEKSAPPAARQHPTPPTSRRKAPLPSPPAKPLDTRPPPKRPPGRSPSPFT